MAPDRPHLALRRRRTGVVALRCRRDLERVLHRGRRKPHAHRVAVPQHVQRVCGQHRAARRDVRAPEAAPVTSSARDLDAALQRSADHRGRPGFRSLRPVAAPARAPRGRVRLLIAAAAGAVGALAEPVALSSQSSPPSGCARRQGCRSDEVVQTPCVTKVAAAAFDSKPLTAHSNVSRVAHSHIRSRAHRNPASVCNSWGSPSVFLLELAGEGDEHALGALDVSASIGVVIVRPTYFLVDSGRGS